MEPSLPKLLALNKELIKLYRQEFQGTEVFYEFHLERILSPIIKESVDEFMNGHTGIIGENDNPTVYASDIDKYFSIIERRFENNYIDPLCFISSHTHEKEKSSA